MKRFKFVWLAIALFMLTAMTACNNNQGDNSQTQDGGNQGGTQTDIQPTTQVQVLENGLTNVSYDGDYGFDEFLENGGAAFDSEVVNYLTSSVLSGVRSLSFGGNPFGCSTIAVQNESGEYIFGRNFDWNSCNAMIVKSAPQNAYSSISTVNLDFIHLGATSFDSLPDTAQAIIALYAPLDGVNEKGLAVSVNMIQDSATINQNTDKPDITTTTAIRLLLNNAATVDEALTLLESYDLHASMNYMVHFAIADTQGKSIVVEYVNNEMVVIPTPIVTNFYLAEGSKHGIGTAQSHTRYNILTERLNSNPIMSMDDVKNALSSVSKGNFGEFESTEWSAVFNQTSGEVHYYHRENYSKQYVFKLK